MDPERARYRQAVEETFLGLSGRGFVLSPRDLDLVERWRERGYPLELVLEALDEVVRGYAASRPRDPVPGRLGYFARAVERIVEARWRAPAPDEEAEAGEPPADADRHVRRRAAHALRRAEEARGETDPAREVLARARRELEAAREVDAWTLTERIDERMVEWLQEVLDADTRARIRAEAEAEVASAGGELLGPRGWADRVAVEVARRVRAHFGVFELAEVVGDEDV